MSTTRIGRIRKLIKKNLEHKDSIEMSRPNMPRSMDHTVTTRSKETNEPIKTKSTIVIFDNTHGRNDRRTKQIEILVKISTDHKNDGRFRVKKGGAGGKRKVKEVAAPKKGKKGGKK